MIIMKPALAIALILVSIISSREIAHAQLNLSPKLSAEPPNLPPGTGKPDDRTPGGTRGPSCEKIAGVSFTPLLPVNNSGFSGYTLTGYPTFWFYVAYKIKDISGNFSLVDAKKNQVYQTTLKLPQTPGFVSISLPATEKPLEKNQAYRWTFTLNCPSSDPLDYPKVWHTGIVQRIDMPALENQLKTSKLEERTKLYIANRIWYDAPTDVAKISERSHWLNLLKVIGLEELEKEPIVGSIVPIEREINKQK
ncbi:MAG: DUF928 domain-containing protein [Coleofasciculaceae cyanobacterium]